ncbi:MAG: hypothetical protein ACRBN8_14895 [Nannocystales bacterium]
MTTHDNVRPLHAGLFARDGHLTMLTLDRFEVGELSTPMCEAVIEHVESCELCANRIASMRSDAVSFSVPPPLAAESKEKPQKWLGTLGIAGTVAAAAALLMMALPEPQQVERSEPEDTPLTASPYTTTAELEGAAMFTPALDFSVAASSSSSPSSSPSSSQARIEHGDRVSWDTAVTLHVSPHEAGYVAVISATQADPNAPDAEELSDTDGEDSRPAVQILMPVTQLEARSGPHALTLEHASRLSTDVADEQLLAIYCEESFDLDDPFDPELPSLREDCTSVELTLTRYGEVADS